MTPKIEVRDYVEHEDGSATVSFECDYTAREALIAEGLLSLIEKAVSEHNNGYDWETKGEDNG